MDLLSRTDFGALLGQQRPPCVSLLMPTTRGVKHEDKKRWKNLVGQAVEKLSRRGLRSSEIKDAIAPAERLFTDVAFWQDVSDGLAAFFAPGVERVYRVPMTIDERVVVGRDFHIKPLLPLISEDGRFFVLAISQKNVRLLQGTRQSVAEIELRGVPKSFDEALQYDIFEQPRTMHTHRAPGGAATNREGIAHGHGAGIDSGKDGLLQFCQAVNRGLEQVLRDDGAPLVLAAAEPLASIYREASSRASLLAEGIDGHPDRRSPQDLRDRALELVQPRFQEGRHRIAALYRQLAGTGRTTHELTDIVREAHDGHLQYLFLDTRQDVWGVFEPSRRLVTLHDRAAPDDEELLNLAAASVLRHGGVVYPMTAEQMPEPGPAAAIFWLPLGERSSKRTITANA